MKQSDLASSVPLAA